MQLRLRYGTRYVGSTGNAGVCTVTSGLCKYIVQ